MAVEVASRVRAGAAPRVLADVIRGHGVLVGIITCAAAGLYFLLDYVAYLRFTIGSYDLVIFDQAIRGYSDFGLPVSIAKSVHDNLGADFHILGDHFSPILATLAPLYWIHDHPVMLMAAQAVLFAAAVPIVWIAARRAVGPAAAYAVAAVFAFGWPLQVASVKGIHEVAFAVPLTALALERVLAGRYRQAALAAGALLLVKEDMGLLVAGIGLLIAWRARPVSADRRLGIGLAVFGVAALALVMLVLIPLAGGQSGYYWTYDQLGANPAEALWHMVAHPLDTLHIAITPERKWKTPVALVIPLLLVPLASPMSLLAVPFIAERIFSANPNHWGPDQHYDAFIWPILVFAAVDALRPERLNRLAARWPRLKHLVPAWAVLAVGATALIVTMNPKFQPWDLPNGHHGRQDRDGAAAAALQVIPDGATVEVDNEFGPHLTHRAKVLLFDDEPRGAEWVIVDTVQTSFPWREYEPQIERVSELLASDDYAVVFAESGYLVLHRRAP